MAMWFKPSIPPPQEEIVIACSQHGQPYLVMRDRDYWHEMDAGGLITRSDVDPPYLWTYPPVSIPKRESTP
jgi:hypothetical protein